MLGGFRFLGGYARHAILNTAINSVGAHGRADLSNIERSFGTEIINGDSVVGKISVSYSDQQLGGIIEYTKYSEQNTHVSSFTDFDTYSQNVEVSVRYILGVSSSVNPITVSVSETTLKEPH